MSSNVSGKNTSSIVSISNISEIGIWIIMNDQEYFIPFALYPELKKATVQALFETAKGLAALATLNFTSAGQHFASAGVFTAVAAASGAAGYSMPGGSTSGSRGMGAGSALQNSYKPSGKREEKKDQQMIVKVYIGNNRDPAAQAWSKKVITAEATAA